LKKSIQLINFQPNNRSGRKKEDTNY